MCKPQLPWGRRAVCVSADNHCIPTWADVAVAPIMKMITDTEAHISVTSRDTSLMLKLVLLRWINTSIMIYVITPQDMRLGVKHIEQISAVLIADCFTKPVLQVLDIPGLVRRHVVAPNAKTQERMNSYFRGTAWSLAERLTDTSKSIFCALFFSVLNPPGLLFCSLANFLSGCWMVGWPAAVHPRGIPTTNSTGRINTACCGSGSSLRN